jgi:hypothetical protein
VWKIARRDTPGRVVCSLPNGRPSLSEAMPMRRLLPTAALLIAVSAASAAEPKLDPKGV